MNRILKIIITMLFCIILSSNGNEIPLYPTPYFHKVGIICKELCTDLQVIHFNKQLHYDWVEHSDYLFNKFLILYNSISELVNNTEETKSYLLEDIQYLFEAVEQVVHNYATTYETHLTDPFYRSLISLLQKSNDKLKELLLINHEITCSV